MDQLSPDLSTATPAASSRNQRPLMGRLRRLVVKELREILRDRRTILTLVVMPLLIYPLLAVVFQRFLVTSIAIDEDIAYMIGVDSDIAREILSRQLQEGEAVLAEVAKRLPRNELDAYAERNEEDQVAATPDSPAASTDRPPSVTVVPLSTEDLRRHVIDSSLHLAVLAQRDLADDPEHGLKTPMKWELVYERGGAALRRVAPASVQRKALGSTAPRAARRGRFARGHFAARHQLLRRAGVFAGCADPVDSRVDDRHRCRLPGDRFDGGRTRTRHT
jgi:hypothetical protein